MLATPAVVYCSIDTFVPLRGKPAAGFPDFSAGLNRSNIPCVWVTSRSRSQLDDPLRRLAHADPFIAEGGCGVYFPTDYFHLRGEKSERRGRFLCIPVAQPQPAAAEALQTLAEDTHTSVVALRSLSSRELAQNAGLPPREAELVRQHDFDEVFFFAGASEQDIRAFREEAKRRGVQVRARGSLWSLAAGASVTKCVREIAKLFNRALHQHAPSIAISPADSEDTSELGQACDRQFIVGAAPCLAGQSVATQEQRSRHGKWIALNSPEDWDQLIQQLSPLH